MNVALLGFGTVGQAVARLILASSAPLTLTHICNRQVARKRVDWVPPSVACGRMTLSFVVCPGGRER